MDLTPKTRRN